MFTDTSHLGHRVLNNTVPLIKVRLKSDRPVHRPEGVQIAFNLLLVCVQRVRVPRFWTPDTHLGHRVFNTNSVRRLRPEPSRTDLRILEERLGAASGTPPDAFGVRALRRQEEAVDGRLRTVAVPVFGASTALRRRVPQLLHISLVVAPAASGHGRQRWRRERVRVGVPRACPAAVGQDSERQARAVAHVAGLAVRRVHVEPAVAAEDSVHHHAEGKGHLVLAPVATTFAAPRSGLVQHARARQHHGDVGRTLQRCLKIEEI